MTGQMLGRSPERSVMRQESRASQTFSQFLRTLRRLAGLDEDDAVLAAASVMGRLEQHVGLDQTASLESQLPSKLREILNAVKFGFPPEPKTDRLREVFVAEVAGDLGVSRARAFAIIRAVFVTVQGYLSDGEVYEVERRLPGDLGKLWIERVEG
jgi:uncharacterized protein (DUF2267 family)